MWVWWIVGVAIVGALAWAVRSSLGRNSDTGASAEELLKRRYARGEINKKDYEERLRDLRR
jgi:uncharacterized membrane protein